MFSNFYACSFTDKDGFKYSSSEKYFMMEKAKYFKDFKILEHMKLEDVPKKVKALGRKVANFDTDAWMKVSKNVMTNGLLLKFG
jgi:hypothetical protein